MRLDKEGLQTEDSSVLLLFGASALPETPQPWWLCRSAEAVNGNCWFFFASGMNSDGPTDLSKVTSESS